MKNALRHLESSLTRLGGDPQHQNAALLEIRDASDSLSNSPVEEEVRCMLAGAAEHIEKAGEPASGDPPPSQRFHRLREQYAEAVDHHPKLALQLGRIADAFATLGL